VEPRIQYAKTTDGVSIAFYALGEGMPLVGMPYVPYSHLQLEWQWRDIRSWYERLAEKRMLVRYDGRGTGLSDREVVDFSLDAHVLDIEAVVDRLDLERFVLMGYLHAGLAAITYAVRHPERVSHLVLWCSYLRSADYLRSSPQLRATRALMREDWETYTETVAHVGYGWSKGEEARRGAELMRGCVTQKACQAFFAASREFDVTALASQVKSPTLVLHRREVTFPTVDNAKALASQIPDARLALLEGSVLSPVLGDAEADLRAIDEFLGEGEEAAGAPEAGAFRTVLFTDVEGSTALTARLGDTKARDLLRQHERIVREALSSHGGSELKTMGDGFMASFSSATKALECSIAMQRAFAAHNESAEEPILVRVGLNAGEPIAEDEDLFGTAVIEAARIAAAAKGGEILVSDVVRQLAKGKDFLFADRGEVALKGFDEPVRLYEVRWREER
jgi:class 3 adenylate cyclase